MEATRRLGQGRLRRRCRSAARSWSGSTGRCEPSNIPGLARAAYADLSAEMRAQVDAYAHGVNAGPRTTGRPAAEFVLLGLDFEPWEPWHALICRG